MQIGNFPHVPPQVEVQRGPQHFSIAQLISEFSRDDWTWHFKKGNHILQTVGADIEAFEQRGWYERVPYQQFHAGRGKIARQANLAFLYFGAPTGEGFCTGNSMLSRIKPTPICKLKYHAQG